MILPALLTHSLLHHLAFTVYCLIFLLFFLWTYATSILIPVPIQSDDVKLLVRTWGTVLFGDVVDSVDDEPVFLVLYALAYVKRSIGPRMHAHRCVSSYRWQGQKFYFQVFGIRKEITFMARFTCYGPHQWAREANDCTSTSTNTHTHTYINATRTNGNCCVYLFVVTYLRALLSPIDVPWHQMRGNGIWLFSS